MGFNAEKKEESQNLRARRKEAGSLSFARIARLKPAPPRARRSLMPLVQGRPHSLATDEVTRGLARGGAAALRRHLRITSARQAMTDHERRWSVARRGVPDTGGTYYGTRLVPEVPFVEFNPAEGAGGMLIDVCHSGESLHQVGWRVVNGSLST